jgi:hypothetical protein
LKEKGKSETDLIVVDEPSLDVVELDFGHLERFRGRRVVHGHAVGEGDKVWIPDEGKRISVEISAGESGEVGGV